MIGVLSAYYALLVGLNNWMGLGFTTLCPVIFDVGLSRSQRDLGDKRFFMFDLIEQLS
jgi:hypothetical protein